MFWWVYGKLQLENDKNFLGFEEKFMPYTLDNLCLLKDSSWNTLEHWYRMSVSEHETSSDSAYRIIHYETCEIISSGKTNTSLSEMEMLNPDWAWGRLNDTSKLHEQVAQTPPHLPLLSNPLPQFTPTAIGGILASNW